MKIESNLKRKNKKIKYSIDAVDVNMYMLSIESIADWSRMQNHWTRLCCDRRHYRRVPDIRSILF